MADSTHGALAILRRRQVQARTGLSRTTLYSRISDGGFPAPVPLGKRSVGWVASEVDAWIAARIAAREAQR